MPSINTLLVPNSSLPPQGAPCPCLHGMGWAQRGLSWWPPCPSPVGGSHRRCRRLAAVSSCRGGMGLRRWPGQQPRCSSPCGGTSWRPSAGHPEPSILQRHGAWTRRQTCLPLLARHRPAGAKGHRYSLTAYLCHTLHGPSPISGSNCSGVPIWGPSAFRASHSGLPRRNLP